MTLRENTERPVTVTIGTNVLVVRRLRTEADKILHARAKDGHMLSLWDGRASERIASVLESWQPRA